MELCTPDSKLPAHGHPRLHVCGGGPEALAAQPAAHVPCTQGAVGGLGVASGPAKRFSLSSRRARNSAIRGWLATKRRTFGNTMAEAPKSRMSAMGDRRVSAVLTSTIHAPLFFLAISGNLAAGSTVPLVPTISTTLDFAL